jgi:hypothetical protein
MKLNRVSFQVPFRGIRLFHGQVTPAVTGTLILSLDVLGGRQPVFQQLVHRDLQEK